MAGTAEHIPVEEIRRILKELAGENLRIPEPSEATFAPEEDFEGDPILRLSIVFPESVAQEDTPWRLVSPLVMRLTRWVMERAEYSRPVVPRVVRLAEEQPAGA